MKYLRCFWLIMSLVFFVGCAKPYTYKDNGRTIELSEHDPFQIVLEGDNSPDFNWVLESIPEFIVLETTDKINNKGRVIDYVFSFKTLSFGEDIIKLIYTDGNSIAKNYELKVIVGTMGRIMAK